MEKTSPNNIDPLSNKSLFSGEVPQVEITPENATFYMQTTFNIHLRCNIPGDPRAKYLYWEKDGQQIASTSRGE